MVYGDLSGDERAVLTAGCYLGQEDQWLSAIGAWSQALDDAGVTAFHATDFFSTRGAFDDDKWRHHVDGRGMLPGGDLHEEFAERFCGVPVDNGLLGFSYSLDVPAFNEILAPELAKERRKYTQAHPKTHTVMSSLVQLDNFLAKRTYRDQGRIQAIFEEEQGDGRFMKFFNESKARDERWTYWFHSFTTAPKSFLPLQMADLNAWRMTSPTSFKLGRLVSWAPDRRE